MAKHTPAKCHAHVITEGDLKIIQDCHEIHLDAEDDYEQQQSDQGSARLHKPKHSTAYSCYTTEKPVYDTLLDLYVKDKLNEKGKKLMDLVSSYNSYFQLALDESEK